MVVNGMRGAGRAWEWDEMGWDGMGQNGTEGNGMEWNGIKFGPNNAPPSLYQQWKKCSYREMYIRMFSTANNWQQPKCPS